MFKNLKLGALVPRKCIVASGVLIENGKVLLIKHRRLGVYIYPGGHVLPTGGTARWRGVITPLAFMKPIGIAEAVGELTLREAARKLAEYEGFKYHGEALR